MDVYGVVATAASRCELSVCSMLRTVLKDRYSVDYANEGRRVAARRGHSSSTRRYNFMHTVDIRHNASQSSSSSVPDARHLAATGTTRRSPLSSVICQVNCSPLVLVQAM